MNFNTHAVEKISAYFYMAHPYDLMITINLTFYPTTLLPNLLRYYSTTPLVY
jgi:hypothetical protein